MTGKGKKLPDREYRRLRPAENGHHAGETQGEAPLRRYGVTAFSRNGTPAPDFPTDALPKPVQGLVKEGAAAIGCPPDAIGLAALVAIGAAIGNSRVIRPKKNWTESATINAAVIADPGEKKTAAIAVATGVVQKLENKLNKDHEKTLDEHAREQREYEAERQDARIKGHAAPPPPRCPTAERVHVNDTTVEALIPLLKENPRGLLLERDELVGWVKSMDQYKAGGKGSDRQFWLSVWSNRPVSVDRKGHQGPISVLKPFIGVVGSIQPDVLPELAENREDGMLERFLFAYPKPINSLWTEDEIGDEAQEEYHELHEKLRNLSMDKDDLGDPVEVPVAFSPEAKELYIAAYNAHKTELLTPGFPASLRSPWAKLEAYLLRLILIVAACRFVEKEGVPERIEPDDVLRGLRLIEYFKDQARRVFGALRGQDPKQRLLEDCGRFVMQKGGSWTGSATELHERLVSEHKPERPEELSKFLKGAAEQEPRFTYETKTERSKDDEDGKWNSRRVMTLSVEKMP